MRDKDLKYFNKNGRIKNEKKARNEIIKKKNKNVLTSELNLKTPSRIIIKVKSKTETITVFKNPLIILSRFFFFEND